MSSIGALRDEEGQTLVFFVLGLVAFVLIVALVVDVGAWMQVQRKVQGVADAAALAGAQDLPFDSAQAQADAASYGRLNSPSTTVQSSVSMSNDTIAVSASRDAPGFFSGLAGITGITVKAHASAGAEPSQSVTTGDLVDTRLVPLVVNASCYGSSTLRFDDSDHLGSCLGVVCPAGCNAGTVSQEIRNGLRGTYGVSPPSLAAAPASATNGNAVGNALQSAEGQTLIMPVFDDADRSGYDVSGFTAFVINRVRWRNDNPRCRPDCKEISGNFTVYKYTTSGTLPLNDAATNYGVSAIGLTG